MLLSCWYTGRAWHVSAGFSHVTHSSAALPVPSVDASAAACSALRAWPRRVFADAAAAIIAAALCAAVLAAALTVQRCRV